VTTQTSERRPNPKAETALTTDHHRSERLRRRMEIDRLRRPVRIARCETWIPCAAHGSNGWRPCDCWRYRRRST
jgi:hypothetical protein